MAIAILACLVACDRSEETTTETPDEQITRLQADNERLETQLAIIAKLASKGEPGIWTLDWNDTAEMFEPTNLERYPDHRATAANVVKGLNQIRPAPGIELLAQRGATVYLRIKERDVLTNQMGSAGAQQYLGSVVISLTSIPGVELVHFDFFEGNHASPGFYSRASFID